MDVFHYTWLKVCKHEVINNLESWFSFLERSMEPIFYYAWPRLILNSLIIKSAQVTKRLIVLVRFHRRLLHLRHRRSANTFHLPQKTPKANFFRPHMVDLWVWEIFLAPILVTLGQGH